MISIWINAESALWVYQTILAVLVWLLVTFACFGLLASAIQFVAEYGLHPADVASEHLEAQDGAGGGPTARAAARGRQGDEVARVQF